MSGESQIIDQFRALAQGTAPNDGDDFRLAVGPCSIRAKYYSGSGSHLILSAPYTKRAPDRVAPPSSGGGYRDGASGTPTATRPLKITCRAEESEDVDAKEAGIAVEAQTGDAAFDKAVFLDSPSQRDVVRYVLADAKVRDGIRLLLEYGFSEVVIDDDQGMITARVSSFPGGDPIPERAQTLAQAFADIVLGVGFVEASGDVHPASWARGFAMLLGFLAIAGISVGPIAFFSLAPSRCMQSDGEGSSLVCSVTGCCTGIGLGFAAGTLIGPILAFLFTRAIRGTSSAHRNRAMIAILTIVVCIELGLLGGAFIGWYG